MEYLKKRKKSLKIKIYKNINLLYLEDLYFLFLCVILGCYKDLILCYDMDKIKLTVYPQN